MHFNECCRLGHGNRWTLPRLRLLVESLGVVLIAGENKKGQCELPFSLKPALLLFNQQHFTNLAELFRWVVDAGCVEAIEVHS